MLTPGNQVSARKQRAFAPVGTIAGLTLALVAGVVILVQAMMADQSDRLTRDAVTGLLSEQQAVVSRASSAWASAPDPKLALPLIRQLDYAMILETNGQTNSAWVAGRPEFADGLGVIGPILSQMIDASLAGPQSGQTQSGLGVIRGQIGRAHV